jgi:hypothetical protein
VLFLAYPLGKGVWMSLTDIKIGRGRHVHRPRELRVS